MKKILNITILSLIFLFFSSVYTTYVHASGSECVETPRPYGQYGGIDRICSTDIVKSKADQANIIIMFSLIVGGGGIYLNGKLLIKS